MLKRFSEKLIQFAGNFLTKEFPLDDAFFSDINKIALLTKPSDIILIEGNSRVSRVIKQITQSPWSHAALYIGRGNQLNIPKEILEKYDINDHDQVIIESEIGVGTILSPMHKYKNYHIRLLRPREIAEADAQKVIEFAISRLGKKYSIKHIFDLARFLFPWGWYPRKWRSVLFQHHALQPTKDICSSMIAASFQSVRFPILPLVKVTEGNAMEFKQRNPLLFTPRDFDYSPYFDIIKYPLHDENEVTWYSKMNWVHEAENKKEPI